MLGSFRKLLDGFGFIAGEDGIDYFFHSTGMSKWTIQLRYCREGMKVEFTPTSTPRGPRATQIEVVGQTLKKPDSEPAS